MLAFQVLISNHFEHIGPDLRTICKFVKKYRFPFTPASCTYDCHFIHKTLGLSSAGACNRPRL